VLLSDFFAIVIAELHLEAVELQGGRVGDRSSSGF
jgi:hypothetical protein